MRNCLYTRLLLGTMLTLMTSGVPHGVSSVRKYTSPAAYISVPKGVVLEGEIAGFGPLKTVTFEAASNLFHINEKEIYANPVSREEMACILRAIQTDTRLGVSIVLNERLITYGGITPKHSIARHLYSTDMFLISVVFGWQKNLTGTSLPGDFKPELPASRRHQTVCFATFDNYCVQKQSGEYIRKACRLDLTLVPMAKERAADGGYLPDLEAAARNEYEPTDRRNRTHVLKHMKEYLQIPVVSRAAAIGEAAAFARSLRRAGIDMNALRMTLQTSHTLHAMNTRSAPAAISITDRKPERHARISQTPGSQSPERTSGKPRHLRSPTNTIQALKRVGNNICLSLNSGLRKMFRRKEADEAKAGRHDILQSNELEMGLKIASQ